MNDLIKTIDALIEEIQKETFDQTDKLQYLQTIELNYKDLYKLNISELLKIFLSSFSNNTYGEILTIINKIVPYIDDLTQEDFYIIYESIKYINTNQNNFYIDDKDYKTSLKTFNKLSYPKHIKKFLTNLFSNNNYMNFEAYNSFISCLISKNIIYIFKDIYNLLNIKYIYNAIDNKFKESKISEKKKQSIINASINKNYVTLLNNIREMQTKRFTLFTQYKSMEKSKNKRILVLNKCKEEILNNSLLDVEIIKKMIANPLFIVMSIDYNNTILTQEYETNKNNMISLNKDNNYSKERLLIKYDCKMNTQKILCNNEDLEEKLKYISETTKKLKKYNNIMLSLINEFSYKELESIINIVKHYLDETFLLDNIYLIKQKKDVFIDNVNTLIKYKINISNVSKYDKSILFMNNNDLVNILNSYSKYELSYDDKIKCYEFLKKDYSYIIDKFIEIEEFDIIKKDLSLLNDKTNTIIKRILFNKSVNEPIINKEEKLLGELKSEEKYYISDEKLNSSIVENYCDIIPSSILKLLKNNKPLSNNNIPELDAFKVDNFSYNFNGIIISINKVNRNYNILINNKLSINKKELLLYSILYNYPNNISNQDIETINDLLKQKIKSLN